MTMMGATRIWRQPRVVVVVSVVTGLNFVTVKRANGVELSCLYADRCHTVVPYAGMSRMTLARSE